jgi:hypothetical protein
MRSTRNVALALIALCALLLGVRALVRRRTPEVGRPVPSGAGSIVTAPHATVSIAKLSSGGTLDNCADVIFATSRTIDVKQLEARGFVLLPSPCAKAYASSVPLASCTRTELEGEGEPVHAIGYYYDAATLQAEDDTYRGQCLGNNGAWAAKPQDDPKLARARLTLSKPHHEFDSLMELVP